MVQLPAKPMQEEDRMPLPRFDIADAVVANRNELPDRRDSPLRIGRDSPGRQNEVAGNEAGEQKQRPQKP